MNAKDLRERYLNFFEERAHRRIPSASLLPENDSTVLFTTAGMHPLVPYLLGEPHPLGRRLVNFQKCLRTNDIEEVGDTLHLTFFEMLGNWSLGDYFKEQSLAWSHEFLTRELGIDPGRLAVTVFGGDETAPRDETSLRAWLALGIPEERIFILAREDNWWGPVGETGPCGPDSEIFYDVRPGEEHPGCRPGCPCGKWAEIWNNVFMEYDRRPDGSYARLKQANVDTGMGVERTLVALNGESDVFTIDTLAPLVRAVEQRSGRRYDENPVAFRVVADHLRSAVFAVADGALPSNVQAGYVVRRLIRRAVRHGRELSIQGNFCAELSRAVVELFREVYPALAARQEAVEAALDGEETKFRRTLERGLKHVQKLIEQTRQAGLPEITGKDAFYTFESFGFPLELTRELAQEAGLAVDEAGFRAAYRRHQEQSRQSAGGQFKSGLAGHSVETIRLHTATHLLHQALRRVLGGGVQQKGSNITPERLRFDFSYPEKLSDAQLAEVEGMVNEQIRRDLPVTWEAMPLEAALQSGALAFFEEKYGEQVKVYTIGDFSKEVCSGPHAARTGELGRFSIVRQEPVSQGVRRIRAVLES